jgi:hypothetical protein
MCLIVILAVSKLGISSAVNPPDIMLDKSLALVIIFPLLNYLAVAGILLVPTNGCSANAI